jgi:hypothetical protein
MHQDNNSQPVGHVVMILRGGVEIKLDKKFDWLRDIRWHMIGRYAHNKKYGPLHDVIIKHEYGAIPRGDFVVDHINRDPTDNRLANLRVITLSENCKNSDYYEVRSGRRNKKIEDDISKRLCQI